ncbi:Transcription elongation factor GreA [Candidatus Magnetomoraceae bacterium gMMP-15]
MDRVPVTKRGFELLKKELEQLKSVERPQNIKAIEEARAHGDLSENAEFEAAKERQAFIQGRISEVEYKLASADIIDVDNLDNDKVVFGSTVLLENIDTGKEVKYQIVGQDEADINDGLISFSSPLASVLIGKEIGHEAILQAPGGKRSYELVDIM